MEKLICGVDEAGRGPVIGPMVMCGILVKEKNINKLKEIGVKDSKLLSKKQREFLYNEVLKIVEDYKVTISYPEEIDEHVFSEESNLNKLEAKKSAEIINELKPDKAILDCPSNNVEAYTDYLSSLLNFKVKELVLEHKADLNYVEVGAASIIAKEIREREVEKIKKEIKEDTGSGYPADPKTKEFIKENYEKHSKYMRKSWQTYKNLIKKKEEKSLLDY